MLCIYIAYTGFQTETPKMSMAEYMYKLLYGRKMGVHCSRVPTPGDWGVHCGRVPTAGDWIHGSREQFDCSQSCRVIQVLAHNHCLLHITNLCRIILTSYLPMLFKKHMLTDPIDF